MSTTLPPRQGKLSWRGLCRVVGCLATGYGAVLLVLMMFEDRLLYHPVAAGRRWIDPAADCTFQDVALQSADGTALSARWYPCDQAKGAVLICHSRAGNLSLEVRQADVQAWHREIGCSVLIFDYPGYGRSAGRPSEPGCYAAAQAAYDWLTQVQQLPPDQILLYGRSLGTAVAVDLASRQPHRALILVSPFTSLPDVALGQIPLVPAHLLMRNRFPSIAKIGRCTRPVFIIHGTNDHMVPIGLGQALYAAAHDPKRLLPIAGAGHGDCLKPAFYPALGRFLREAEGEGKVER